MSGAKNAMVVMYNWYLERANLQKNKPIINAIDLGYY